MRDDLDLDLMRMKAEDEVYYAGLETVRENLYISDTIYSNE